MNNLAEKFPSLSLFSNIDWPTVNAEFMPFSQNITFPEYLQLKAEQGDCPAYLFELAFYEMAIAQVQEITEIPPLGTGLHLNPSTAFLSLQFDINRMLSEAEAGEIAVHERENVLCLFLHQEEVTVVELDEDSLSFLQELEEGPLPLEELDEEIQEFIDLGLVLKVL